MFPEPKELLLIGYSIESIWTPKSKSNTSTPKTNSQTCWPRETSHVMNGIIFLCLLNISHFISADCSEVMSKRTQKDSGEERVTAKSKPMMSLIAQSSERAPSALSSIASESPGKTRQESQSPLSAQAEMYDRTEKPVVCYDTSHERHRLAEKAHSSSYSEWNIDKTWSSQEWKSDELMDDRTERPVDCSQHTDQFTIANDETNSKTEAETELSRSERPHDGQTRGTSTATCLHFLCDDGRVSLYVWAAGSLVEEVVQKENVVPRKTVLRGMRDVKRVLDGVQTQLVSNDT